MSDQQIPGLPPGWTRKALNATARLASTVLDDDAGLASVTLSTPGMKPVVIDKAAAKRIKASVRRLKKKP